MPPSLNFDVPNPNIDFDHAPFYVNTRLQEKVERLNAFAQSVGVLDRPVPYEQVVATQFRAKRPLVAGNRDLNLIRAAFNWAVVHRLVPGSPFRVGEREWRGLFGRHHDPVGAMRITVDLEPEKAKSVGFAIPVDSSRDGSATLLRKWLDVARMREALLFTPCFYYHDIADTLVSPAHEGWLARPLRA